MRANILSQITFLDIISFKEIVPFRFITLRNIVERILLMKRRLPYLKVSGETAAIGSKDPQSGLKMLARGETIRERTRLGMAPDDLENRSEVRLN